LDLDVRRAGLDIVAMDHALAVEMHPEAAMVSDIIPMIEHHQPHAAQFIKLPNHDGVKRKKISLRYFGNAEQVWKNVSCGAATALRG
jgi:hypothetical protein